MLKISYSSNDKKAVLSWNLEDADKAWVLIIQRTLFDNSEDVVWKNSNTLSLPWWSFLSIRRKFGEIVQGYGIKRGIEWDIDQEAENFLKESLSREISFKQAKIAKPILEEDLKNKLSSVKFARSLTSQQIRNIIKIASLPAGATFSVPGAGKTTEALATFFYRSSPGDFLLVVAPKNAFGSWDEQILSCIPTINQKFVRLHGGKENIIKLLEKNPRFMIITYQQMPRVSDIIAAYLSKNKTYVFLDESHRIKSGAGCTTARAILNISHLPVGKLIMSGTPMPQSEEDLVPQFSFLYPEIEVSKDNIIELIQPIYVRTNKDELGLPPITRNSIKLKMAPSQSKLYNLMKYQVSRDAAEFLSSRSKNAFRALGRSVLRLLKFVSNPALLSQEIGFADQALLAEVLEEGDSPKLSYVVKRARELAREGKKVLIWSSFVSNVEILANRLSDLGAVYIHGGVDAGDEDDNDTREGKILNFHNDPNVRIMVANPAAAGEGISLHTVCHHAIYLDRTFNASHYLQSEDRIHRLGLSSDQKTIIEIIECIGTIDETVHQRLKYKISKMAETLKDSSLHVETEPYDPPASDDEIENEVVALDDGDVQSLIDITKN